jgi:hypothetical protein
MALGLELGLVLGELGPVGFVDQAAREVGEPGDAVAGGDGRQPGGPVMLDTVDRRRRAWAAEADMDAAAARHGPLHGGGVLHVALDVLEVRAQAIPGPLGVQDQHRTW